MKELKIRISASIALNEASLKERLKYKFGVEHYLVKRRSVDARKKEIMCDLILDVYDQEDHVPNIIDWHQDKLPNVSSADEVLIVGSGPAGLFAAIECIEQGLRPIVIDRGRDVTARRRDIAAINKEHIVNEDSNYCFGEGGAGTYSDGKLYTRSTKRGDVQKVLEILVAHGAPADILIDAHPHIGTNRLPKVIEAMRWTIIEHGGNVFFETKLTDLEHDGSKITKVYTNDKTFEGLPVILATGHSARDIFNLLAEKGIEIQAKPFAVGLRIEHQQSLIDGIQYGQSPRPDYLPAASYSLKSQVMWGGDKHGVFSFCMCPGGFMVPSATSPGEVAMNGMSPSRRDSKFSNSGIVVTVNEKDFAAYSEKGPLAGVHYQASLEKKACEMAGGTQTAPAQRMVDFVKGRVSSDLPESSYQPGLASTDLKTVLPEKVTHVLQSSLRFFDKRMKGYYTNEAVVSGVESRTSCPVLIPRDKETLQHVQLKNLFPCGEGAGYAGGIVSAAMDGQRCAEAVKNS